MRERPLWACAAWDRPGHDWRACPTCSPPPGEPEVFDPEPWWLEAAGAFLVVLVVGVCVGALVWLCFQP